MSSKRYPKRPMVPRSLTSVSETPPNAYEVMEVACLDHDAAQGEPCFRVAVGVCADRVSRWLARSSAEAPSVPAELPAGPPPTSVPPMHGKAAESQSRRRSRPRLPRPRITAADVRSSAPVDLNKLSPLERRAAEVRASQRAEAESRRLTPSERAKADAVSRERQARAVEHWRRTHRHHHIN